MTSRKQSKVLASGILAGCQRTGAEAGMLARLSRFGSLQEPLLLKARPSLPLWFGGREAGWKGVPRVSPSTAFGVCLGL